MDLLLTRTPCGGPDGPHPLNVCTGPRVRPAGGMTTASRATRAMSASKPLRRFLVRDMGDGAEPFHTQRHPYEDGPCGHRSDRG